MASNNPERDYDEWCQTRESDGFDYVTEHLIQAEERILILADQLATYSKVFTAIPDRTRVEWIAHAERIRCDKKV